jgi:hypothetical protein
MKTLFLIMFSLSVFAVDTNRMALEQESASMRTWTLRNGEKYEGEFVSSGSIMVVVKRHGTNCFLKVSDLSTNDHNYVVKIQSAREQARLDAQTKQLTRQGQIELTVDIIKNYPERISKYLWMDAEFVEFNGDELLSLTERGQHHRSERFPMGLPITDLREAFIGFRVRDKNGDVFYKCYATKNKQSPIADQIAKLKRGDMVRLFGEVSSPSRFSLRFLPDLPNMEALGEDKGSLWFQVTSIQMITSATKSVPAE